MPEPGSFFSVHYSEYVRLNLEVLALKAKENNLGDEFLQVLQEIDQNLQESPRSFGDPQFTLRAIKLDIYLVVRPPLAVSYGVYQDQNLVWIREVIWFPRPQ